MNSDKIENDWTSSRFAMVNTVFNNDNSELWFDVHGLLPLVYIERRLDPIILYWLKDIKI